MKLNLMKTKNKNILVHLTIICLIINFINTIKIE
jgi:hypothetical protein